MHFYLICFQFQQFLKCPANFLSGQLFGTHDNNINIEINKQS